MEQQNILMVVVDQLAARALEGKRETPNLDRLREMSQSAECCITQCPLCQPSRASFWSGLYPHETNVLSNGRKWPANPVPSSVETLGRVLSKAGYETRHFGKRHDAGALGGFWCAEEGQTVIPDAPSLPYNFDTYNDVFTHKQALDFLRTVKNVDWTYISPAGDFQADGERTGKYIKAGEELTLNSKNESIISYADYAIALVDEIEQGGHSQQRISVVRA